MTIAEELTAAMNPLLDAVYAAGKKAGGVKNRKEWDCEIKESMTGANAYVALLKDEILGKNRTLDTLFVRVDCDFAEPIANTVVKTWASNVAGKVIPLGYTQLILRWDKNAANNAAYTDLTLHSDTVGGNVGQVHITEDGELRLYSGSYGTYYLRPCKVKVIVEW